MRDVSTWSEHDRLEYSAARFAYRHRWDLCPHPIDVDGAQITITWATWFHLRFGMTLDEYQQKLTERDAQ